MRIPKALALASLLISVCSNVSADIWTTGTITEIRVVALGNSATDGIAVFGSFTPSMGCANGGFMLFSTDSYFKESYALLLAAKAAGKPIKFGFSFCTSAGYGRVNSYSMTD